MPGLAKGQLQVARTNSEHQAKAKNYTYCMFLVKCLQILRVPYYDYWIHFNTKNNTSHSIKCFYIWTGALIINYAVKSEVATTLRL